MPVIQVKNPKGIIQVRGLKYIRLQRGISIRELARRINYDEKRIRTIEKGGSPKKETIEVICKKLSIDETQITQTVSVEAAKIFRLEQIIKFRKSKKKIIDRVLSLKWNKELLLNN